MHRRWLQILVGVVIVAGLVAATYLTGARISSNTDNSHITCIQVQQLRAAILVTVKRSKILLTTSPPAYYSTHPAELQAQIRQVNQQIKDFAPKECP